MSPGPWTRYVSIQSHTTRPSVGGRPPLSPGPWTRHVSLQSHTTRPSVGGSRSPGLRMCRGIRAPMQTITGRIYTKVISATTAAEAAVLVDYYLSTACQGHALLAL